MVSILSMLSMLSVLYPSPGLCRIPESFQLHHEVWEIWRLYIDRLMGMKWKASIPDSEKWM